MDGIEEIEVNEPCDYGAARLTALKVVPHYELKAFQRLLERRKIDGNPVSPELAPAYAGDRRITDRLVIQQ